MCQYHVDPFIDYRFLDIATCRTSERSNDTHLKLFF